MARIEVLLPQWGMGMSEGSIVSWLKKVGDQVVEAPCGAIGEPDHFERVREGVTEVELCPRSSVERVADDCISLIFEKAGGGGITQAQSAAARAVGQTTDEMKAQAALSPIPLNRVSNFFAGRKPDENTTTKCALNDTSIKNFGGRFHRQQLNNKRR